MSKHNGRSIDWNELPLLMFPLLRPGWRDVLVLLLGYVVLDWASYIYPIHGLNITPWNPPPALGLVFFMLFGARAALPFALAILTADLGVRHLSASWPTSIVLASLLTLGYGAIAAVLRWRANSAGLFRDRRGLLDWCGIIAAGTLFNSALFVGTLALFGVIPASSAPQALLRHWAGDVVGIVVTMPMLWMLLDPRGRTRLRALAASWTPIAYLAATAAALWVAFGIGAEADFKYCYVLFLPIVWAAARQGLTGAVLCAALVQLGIIGAVQWRGYATATVFEIQILTLALALVGFFIGVVVDEKERVSAELRQTLRLAAAGEIAGALAHELNQPLTALSMYGTACEHLLEQGETGEPLRAAIRRIVAESFRAAEVVRRLRDFFRTGATRLERVALGELLSAATAHVSSRAQRQGIALAVDAVPPCVLLADRLQLEVVLHNLLSNAFDAVAAQAPEQRRVRLSAQRLGPGRVCICVDDSGPGLSWDRVERLFEPFQSSKSGGLGMGLAISRAIVEAHGGSLSAEAAGHGLFKVVLPVEEKADDAG